MRSPGFYLDSTSNSTLTSSPRVRPFSGPQSDQHISPVDSTKFAFHNCLIRFFRTPPSYPIILISSKLQNHPSIKALASYMLQKSIPDQTFHTALQSLFQSQNHVGFVFCERLINMPVQVIPPMYRMLNDEIKWAVDDVRLPHSYHSKKKLSLFNQSYQLLLE